MTGPRRPRLPTPEDRALWDTVAKSVRPLKRPAGGAAADATVQSRPTERQPTLSAATPAAKKRTSDPPRLAPLDRRLKARIGRGTVAIDARVDLHGLTQATAHHRLRSFLVESQAAGARLVLVITGKGHPGNDERGVLRRLVPIWLASTELRSFIVGYEAAGRSHGGEGALYVRIRSRRKSGV